MIDFSAIAFPASEDENEVIVVDDQDVQHGRKGREKISGKVETENEEESFWHGGWDLTELPRAATNSLTAMAACGGAVGKQHPVIASTTTYDHFRPPQPPLPQARPPALLPKTIPVGKLTVTNVVITCDLGTQLDLRQIATKLPNTMFLKTKTGGTNWCCTVELRRPRAILRVFESGKVLCIGAKSLERAERAVQLLAARLSRSGLAAGAAVSDLKVQNMVLVSTLPTPTEESLQHLAKVSRVCTYDRSVFAGLKYDPPGRKGMVRVFMSGKCIVAGRIPPDCRRLSFSHSPLQRPNLMCVLALSGVLSAADAGSIVSELHMLLLDPPSRAPSPNPEDADITAADGAQADAANLSAHADGVVVEPVSYTHLTLPTICSV
eukprot:2707752-Rhodomonas_salina.1